MTTYNGCVGKKHYGLSESTNWYGFSHKPISQDTRCEFCYQHMKRLGIADAEGMYRIVDHSSTIDCDTLSDHRLTSLTTNNFRVRVESADGQTPYLVNTASEEKRNRGVLIVDMPETADYAVVLENLRPSYDDSSYYTYTMKVGDREVVVNDGRKIYYQKKTRVSGFRTGSSESFRFVANTPGNGDASAESAVSNVITIVIDRFRRERQPRYISAFSGLDLNRKYRGFGSPAGFGSERESSFGSPDGFGSSTGFGSRSDRFNVAGFPGFASASASASAVAFATPNVERNFASSVVGGRTETGNQYVNNVHTTSTDDTFVRVETFAVTIQLIHLADGSNVSVNQAQAQFELRREQERVAEEERRRVDEQRRKAMLDEQAKLLVPIVPPVSSVVPPVVPPVPPVPPVPSIPVIPNRIPNVEFEDGFGNH